MPLKNALDWPVFASYDELQSCAAWMGGRIPTFEEARSVYTHVEALKKKEAEKHLSRMVPAVNGYVAPPPLPPSLTFTNPNNSHLCNNGVEISPPATPPAPASEADTSSSTSKDDLFTGLDGANVGFRHWHPVPITSRGNKLAGQAEMGGVWEWTSTVLRPWDGFEAMPLYPGYTADFFDEKHNIVLGGSWATHPRIAGRRSL